MLQIRCQSVSSDFIYSIRMHSNRMGCVCPWEMYLPMGDVSAQGVSTQGCLPGGSATHTPVDRQTPVKILPRPKLRFRAGKTCFSGPSVNFLV